MTDQYDILIDQLITARKNKGWTQRTLAEASGMPQSSIARIESKKSVPGLITFQQIVSALGAVLSIVENK